MCPVVHKSFAQKVAEVVPVVIEPVITSAVEDYLTENPPSGGITINDVKTDSEIADSLAKRHSLGADNQDLSGYEPANTNIQAHVISAHAPSNAQKNSDILKSEIEAVLIGEISSHTHPSGGGGLTQQQIEGMI